MVFMFIIPAIPAILGNFILPLMLGAKDVAFPRVNLLSWYCYIVGSLFFLWILVGGLVGSTYVTAIGSAIEPAIDAARQAGGGSLENVKPRNFMPWWAFGAFLEGSGSSLSASLPWWLPYGLDTGWTFYTPFSVTTSSGVLYATIGVFILGFSSILTGVNFIATIHMLRPKNMGWFRLPLFLWSLYATSIIQILATPVLGITVLLLLAERTLGVGIFDPDKGGDPVLFQHFFWFYSHPAVYIMILPAMGVISELISIYCRKHIFGYKFIAFSSLAIALLSFLVWGHHMFTSGQSAMLNAIFSLLTMTVAIPSAVKVFNWLSTMYGGNIRLDTPMLYALGFIWLFTIGGLTGVFLATLAIDIHVHDTYFIVAHFHYVMVGSTLFAFLGGMYHWWPKMFGRMFSERWGRIGWLVVFLGFNVTFFIQFVAGSLGMPRRYATYPDEFWIYHVISTIGSYILAVGLFAILFNWVHSLVAGRAWVVSLLEKAWARAVLRVTARVGGVVRTGVLLPSYVPKVGPLYRRVAEPFCDLFVPRAGSWTVPMIAPANPWGGNSLEWQTTSPPPHENFEGRPVGDDPYRFSNWRYDEQLDGYVLPRPEAEPAREKAPDTMQPA
jgi:cytochrome c oxidase subunit 1